jgi:hypothetical protein
MAGLGVLIVDDNWLFYRTVWLPRYARTTPPP